MSDLSPEIQQIPTGPQRLLDAVKNGIAHLRSIDLPSRVSEGDSIELDATLLRLNENMVGLLYTLGLPGIEEYHDYVVEATDAILNRDPEGIEIYDYALGDIERFLPRADVAIMEKLYEKLETEHDQHSLIVRIESQEEFTLEQIYAETEDFRGWLDRKVIVLPIKSSIKISTQNHDLKNALRGVGTKYREGMKLPVDEQGRHIEAIKEILLKTVAVYEDMKKYRNVGKEVNIAFDIVDSISRCLNLKIEAGRDLEIIKMDGRTGNEALSISETELWSIVDNVANNAIAQRKPEQEKAQVRVYTEKAGTNLILNITDFGRGISYEQAERLNIKIQSGQKLRLENSSRLGEPLNPQTGLHVDYAFITNRGGNLVVRPYPSTEDEIYHVARKEITDQYGELAGEKDKTVADLVRARVEQIKKEQLVLGTTVTITIPRV